MEKTLVWVLVLLLVFALVTPVLVYKTTGLSMLQFIVGVPTVKSSVMSVTTVTERADSSFMKVVPPAFCQAYAEKNQVMYATNKIDKYFSDLLPNYVDSTKVTAVRRHEVNYLYAGHWQGARDAEVDVRAWTESAEPLFDFCLPGSLLSKEGFSGNIVTDFETARMAVVGKMSDVMGRILNLSPDQLQKLSSKDVETGFIVEKMPITGNRWSVFGVVRVPVYVQYWGETGYLVSSCPIPHTTLNVYIKLELPESFISSSGPLGVKVENFQVLGLYNGSPLSTWSKIGGKIPAAVEKIERFLLGAGQPSSPILERLSGGVLEEAERRVSITDPHIWVSVDGVAWEEPAGVEAKFFDFNFFRGIKFDPKIEFITGAKFFDYVLEQNPTSSCSISNNETIVELKIIGGRGKHPFTYEYMGKSYNRAKIRVYIPVAWTAVVSYNLPDNNQYEKLVESWVDALKNKLGFKPEEIGNRLLAAIKSIRDNLASMGLDVSAIEQLINRLTKLKPEDIPGNLPAFANYILDAAEQVHSARLPSISEILGPYIHPVTEFYYQPHPAELPTPDEISYLSQLGKPIYTPSPISLKLPEPIGAELPDVVYYSNVVPKQVQEVSHPEKSSTQPYVPPYTAEMYARDAILMVAVVLGSVGAGLLALRLIRK